MAIEKLRTNYKDDILDTSVSASRRYNMTTNSDGTISLEDVSTYDQVGDNYGATDINKLNTSVNALIDSTSNINNTPDSQKSVLYAASAGMASSAANANTATRAINADSAGVVDNDFILVNQSALTFNSNKVCAIADTRITANSLADVYFTSDTENVAERAVIKVDTYDGRVELKAGRVPEATVKATIRIRVVTV